MAPYIAKQPRTVAAFLVGIAMKESKFGVYAPHDAEDAIAITTGDIEGGRIQPHLDIAVLARQKRRSSRGNKNCEAGRPRGKQSFRDGGLEMRGNLFMGQSGKCSQMDSGRRDKL